MLLDNAGTEASQEEITEAAGAAATIEEQGTRVDQLAQSVKTLAPHLVLYYKDHASIEDIRSLLFDFNLPVGVEWQGIFEDEEEEEGEEDFGHYSIIIHLDEKRGELIIVDPYRNYVERDRIISTEEFQKRWWDSNEFTDSVTGRKKIIKDTRLLFVITSPDSTLEKKMGLRRS